MIFLMLFHLLVCILLVLIILIQPSKGEGLTETLGGSAAQTILGSRAGTWLTRATAVFAVLFIVSCLLLGWLSTQRTRSIVKVAPIGEKSAPVKSSTEENSVPTKDNSVPVVEEKAKEAEKPAEPQPAAEKSEEKPAEPTKSP